MKVLRSGHFSGLAAAALLCGAGLCPATGQLLGPEFQVNTYTTSSQGDVAVAAGGSGNFVVVWRSFLQDGSSDGVFAQRFDATGSDLGIEFQVNTFTTNGQSDPVVAVDGVDNFLVVWSGIGVGESGVFGRRFDSAGNPAGGQFQINTYTTGIQSGAAVAADGSGNFVVVWESNLQDGSSLGVFGQRFDSAGDELGIEFQVSAYTTGFQGRPAVATDGGGKFVVVWQDLTRDGSSNGVFGQRFSSAGSRVGSEFRVNSYTTGGQGYPAVAADGAGGFVVVWSSHLQDGSSYGVFGQRFNPAGAPAGSEFQVNTATLAEQIYPAVSAGGAGNFVVAWQGYDPESTDYGVFGQRFNPVGSRVGSEFQVNSHTTNDQRYPAVAADGAGNFVVAWHSNGQDGSDYGVFGRQVTIAIFADDFEVGDVCAWSDSVGSGDSCPP